MPLVLSQLYPLYPAGDAGLRGGNCAKATLRVRAACSIRASPRASCAAECATAAARFRNLAPEPREPAWPTPCSTEWRRTARSIQDGWVTV